MLAQGAWDGRVDLAVRVVCRLRNCVRGFQLMARVGWLSGLLPTIAALLLLASIGYAPDAGAQNYQCVVYPGKCTQPQAYAEAKAYADTVMANYDPAKFNPCVSESVKTYTGYVTYSGKCKANEWSVGQKSFYYAVSCKEEPDFTGTGPWSNQGSAKNGSLGCRNGCDGAWFSGAEGSKTWSATGDICPDDEKENCNQMGAGYFWNSLLRVCEPHADDKCPNGGKPNSLGQCAPEPCPAGKIQQADGTCKNKSNECPAGQIKSPDGKCLPGDGQCASGEVRGADGTCKKDKDGDGKPDPGEEGEGPDGEKAKDAFSGGDDCNSPPTCSGSPIMCGQARIQWRIDCNTRKNRNVAGGHCGQPPICTGEKCDALEYTGLLMQWRTACATEKLVGKSDGGGNNADLTAIRNALTGTGGVVSPGDSLPGSGAWATPSGTPPITPDTRGYGWGGSCPAIPAISFMGASIQFDVTPLCDWLSLGSFFVMGLAALGSLRIVASKDA